MNTQTVEQTIEQYIRAWNEKEPEKIEAMLKKCWAANGAYVDPRYDPMQWTDGLVRIIAESQETLPDRRVNQVSKVDAHHSSGRYQWEVVMNNGDRTEGLDYVEFDSDNRIARLVMFFGALAQN